MRVTLTWTRGSVMAVMRKMKLTTVMRKEQIYLIMILIGEINMQEMVGWFMVFSSTFNNISVISWQSFLLVEETRVPGENH